MNVATQFPQIQYHLRKGYFGGFNEEDEVWERVGGGGEFNEGEVGVAGVGGFDLLTY